MFGLGFGEILILIIVGIVVVGPRKLPTLMRSTGQWISKLRRMSTELRAQSGIDDLIRQEGLEREIQEIRSLSRVNIVDTLMAPAIGATAVQAPTPKPAPKAVPVLPPEPLREREYPLIGCDAYGALADDVEPPPPPETPSPASKPAPALEAAPAPEAAPTPAPAPAPTLEAAPEAAPAPAPEAAPASTPAPAPKPEAAS
ncbi:MAG TPA: Sec-independent protein translocase protein TatB [Polyangiaceae bacterium]|nr:Sec-independent protein translocase protein TatB [Polyangiaceae bacterium]